MIKMPKLVGGFGEMKSNGGTQYYQQDRVYSAISSSDIAMAHPANLTGGSYMYLVLDEQNMYIRNDGCIGTLTTDGSTPKHNNRIIEVIDEVCDPLR